MKSEPGALDPSAAAVAGSLSATDCGHSARQKPANIPDTKRSMRLRRQSSRGLGGTCIAHRVTSPGSGLCPHSPVMALGPDPARR